MTFEVAVTLQILACVVYTLLMSEHVKGLHVLTNKQWSAVAGPSDRAPNRVCESVAWRRRVPVVFPLLRGPQQLLDVLGHLLRLQDDVLRARQGGVRLGRVPCPALLGVAAAVLLAAAAHAAHARMDTHTHTYEHIENKKIRKKY